MKELKEYICLWCDCYFTAEAKYTTGNGKKGSGSNQIRCPNCHNLIPTFKKERTGNVVGRKHTHKR